MNTKKIIINVPKRAKTDLLKLLSDVKPLFPYNIDSFLYILNKIVQMPLYNRRFKHLKMVPLYSKILRTELGKHYKRYLEYLIDHDIINTDNHYIVSTPDREGKCKCYGLTSKYKRSSLISHEITKNTLLKKIITWKKDFLGKNINDHMLGKLYNMMQGFEIDIDSAENYLNDLKSKGKISQRNIDMELNKCRRINSKKDSDLSLFITKDNYNRVHTNFTNLSKHIRENFLYLNGKRVIGIDIVSSQASILYSVMNEYVETLKSEQIRRKENPFELGISTIRKDVRDKYVNSKNTYHSKYHVYDGNINNSIIKINNMSLEEIIIKSKKDLDKFKNILLTEGIYEFFQNRWELMNNEYKSRSYIKNKWITYVFGRGYTPYTKQMNNIWSIEFPMLTKLLNHFKLGDYKALSHTLQRKESNIVFNKLCPEVDKQFNISYCTVHDSIIVDSDYADDVSYLFDSILEDNGILTGTSY